MNAMTIHYLTRQINILHTCKNTVLVFYPFQNETENKKKSMCDQKDISIIPIIIIIIKVPIPYHGFFLK
jgi:hypothetical protein